MRVNLPPDVERHLGEAVSSGRYADASEAVAEGLRLLFAHELQTLQTGALPPGWAESLDRGADDLLHGRLVDADSVLARMDAEVKAYFARRAAAPGT